jgi:hypothetical protein
VPNTNTTVTAAAHPAANPLATGPNDDGSYLVQPGAYLNVTAGLGPDSVIVDDGGTVIFNSAAKESGTIFVLGEGTDKGALVFGNLSFISSASPETIKVDGDSILGIAAMPTSEQPKEFLWGNINPTAGSFNIAFPDLMGGLPVVLNVALLGGAPNTLPAWSFYQVTAGLTGSFSGVFSANSLVPTGALNTSLNPTFT